MPHQIHHRAQTPGLPRYRSLRRRSKRGGVLAEAVGACALLLPLLMMLMMATMEISFYFVIRQQLACVARQLAHELAYMYGDNTGNYTGMNSAGTGGSGTGNTGDTNYTNELSAIAVPGVVEVNTLTDPTYVTTNFTLPNGYGSHQGYVTCHVTYAGGSGLPSFPWSPVGTVGGVFSVGVMKVQSAASWPIPY